MEANQARCQFRAISSKTEGIACAQAISKRWFQLVALQLHAQGHGSSAIPDIFSGCFSMCTRKSKSKNNSLYLSLFLSRWAVGVWTLWCSKPTGPVAKSQWSIVFKDHETSTNLPAKDKRQSGPDPVCADWSKSSGNPLAAEIQDLQRILASSLAFCICTEHQVFVANGLQGPSLSCHGSDLPLHHWKIVSDPFGKQAEVQVVQVSHRHPPHFRKAHSHRKLALRLPASSKFIRAARSHLPFIALSLFERQTENQLCKDIPQKYLVQMLSF